jgi:Mn2+/Fe2+ NRAMP family transporter
MPRERRWGWGPGIVFLLTAIGPQDLVSNSAAGAEFQYTLLWALVPVLLIRYAILEASSRYVLATGESLMAGYARMGRWLMVVLFVAILAKRLVSGLYQVVMLGQAIDFMVPPGLQGHQTVWALASWGLGFAVLWWGRYPVVERASVPLLMLLGGSIVLAAIGSRPDWGQALHGLLVPSLPPGRGMYGYSLILMALIGSGVASLSNLKYASFVRERGWRDASFLRRQRIDLIVSGALFISMLFLLQVAAAATLGRQGVTLSKIEDLLLIFTTALGPYGRIVFGIGVWTAVFTKFVGANTGYSMLMADIWHGSLSKDPQPVEHPTDTPAYRWTILFFAVPPLLVLFATWNPVWLALAVAIALAALTPLIVVALLWLCNNKRLMGDHASGWVSNVTLTLALVATLYLTYTVINH